MLSVCDSSRSKPPRGFFAEKTHPHSLLDKGRALGLSAAYEALQFAGGSLAVSRRECETALHIYFPAAEGA